MAEFSDSIRQWAQKSNEHLTAVRRRSIELLAEEMATTRPQGGRVPFLTGNLARSLLASTNGPVMMSNGPYAGGNVGAVTATLSLATPVWLGYQANYAHRQNYGFVGTDALGRSYNQAGAHFVEYAIQMWPSLVERAATELKSGAAQ